MCTLHYSIEYLIKRLNLSGACVADRRDMPWPYPPLAEQEVLGAEYEAREEISAAVQPHRRLVIE